MTIKLIATDLDGTFVDDQKQMLAENIRAMTECAERGIQIVPATGRTIIGIPDELKNLPGVRYAITVNGAVVVDLKTEEVISSC
ncbi:MAG: HAD family phosphatase, partial [Lachnospiraceae bacterium]|nr:HAD family phosphatase [Lachnospiraceae bacterium]